MRYEGLSETQIEHFLENGYVRIPEAIDPKIAAEWTAWAFERLGYNRHDSSTWEKERIHLDPERIAAAREIAPHAWKATCGVVGGAERILTPYIWADTFVVNLREGADDPYRVPSSGVPGWHKDGYFFKHFLDSPEQGLLTIVCWTDVRSRGGGTFIAPDSIGIVARYLAEHPEGVEPGYFGTLVHQCHDFREVTARAGDVILVHPFMLHTVSQNHLQIPRIISNPPLSLREPMNFNRADQDKFSLVERCVLRALGVPRFDFQPSTSRRNDYPQWLGDAQAAIASRDFALG